MISDVILEQIIKKKYEGKDYLKAILYVILGLLVPTLIIYILLYLFGVEVVLVIGSYLSLLYIGGIAIAIYLIRNSFIEYEYLFVNGELTVDKIIAKSKRKRMINLDVKLVEDMGIYDPAKFAKRSDATTLVYSDTYSGEGDLYMDFRHPIIGRTILVIKSSERLGKALKPYVKRSIHKEVFPNV